MPQQLPSGRWRTRVRHPHTGKQINARDVIGGPTTYATEKMAKAAEEQARKTLQGSALLGVTVGEWWTTWTTDPLWERPSESTNIHYKERTVAFARAHWDTPIHLVGDEQVAAWLKGGANRGTVDKLRIMFNDAASIAAGRLVQRNPFVGLRLPRARGRKDIQPPDQAAIQQLLAIADKETPPSFAAFLNVAVHSGMRPGELDALRWDWVDFRTETIYVREQWCAKTGKFTEPKHGSVREIALTEPAAARLQQLPRESEFAFTTLRGSHYTPSSRDYHWKLVRGLGGCSDVHLYTVTRHYFGWYALNVLGLSDHVIAEQFGHRDGGKLVRTTYGHPDAKIAREKIREAYRHRPIAPTPLRLAQ